MQNKAETNRCQPKFICSSSEASWYHKTELHRLKAWMAKKRREIAQNESQAILLHLASFAPPIEGMNKKFQFQLQNTFDTEQNWRVKITLI